MKLGFSTKLCEEYTLDKIENLAQRTGVNYIEFQVGKDQKHGLDQLYNKSELIEEISLFFEHSILIPWVLATSFVIGDKKSNIKEIINDLRRWSEVAYRLGVSYLRVFPKHDGSIDYNLAVSTMQKVSKAIEEYDVSILVETHGTISTGKAMAEFIRRVSRPNVKVIWDIAHTVVHCESIKQSYNCLKPYLEHVHIKDFARLDDNFVDGDPYSRWKRFVQPGKGDFPLEEYINLLHNEKYKGVICLETPSSYASAEQCLTDILNFYNNVLGN